MAFVAQCKRQSGVADRTSRPSDAMRIDGSGATIYKQNDLKCALNVTAISTSQELQKDMIA